MASYIEFDDFIRAVCEGEHVLSTAGCLIKGYLSNEAPVPATDAVKADIAEIATGSGYTGPVDMENTGSESGGTYTVALTDKTITASGGSVGPFRYAIFYNDTHASDGLVGAYDYGSAITLADGESVVLDAQAAMITIGFAA